MRAAYAARKKKKKLVLLRTTKGRIHMGRLVLLVILLGGPLVATAAQQSSSQCAPEPEAVVAAAAALNIFKDAKDSFWPGYNLSTRPLLFYSPGRWSLLINATLPADGFQPYQLTGGSQLQLRCGSIDGLAGQLIFDYRLGKETVFAIPYASSEAALQIPGGLVVTNLAIIVHEVFHQFQRGSFATIMSRSEDEYPILNEANSALAALEMRILADAIREQSVGRARQWRRLAAMFVAVRDLRWQKAPTSVRQFERAMEFREGTAHYVEVRGIGHMAWLCSTRRASGDVAQACSDFDHLDSPAYLMKGFRDRFPKAALRPDDVPRNRVYFTGAAIGLLLDALKSDWKTKVMRPTADYTISGQLRIALGIGPAQFDQMVREAQARYRFDEILVATRHLIQEYQAEYRTDMARFEAQGGFRIEVDVPFGVGGSWALQGRRYIVDDGRRVFGSEYSVYSLRQRAEGSLSLLIEKAGVLEESAPRGGRRLRFFSPTITSITIDGQIIDSSKPGTTEFRELALAGDGFSLETTKPGLLTISPNKIGVAFSESVR
jgi:hypothetical protein